MSERVSQSTDWMKPEERLSVVNKDTLSKYHIYLNLFLFFILVFLYLFFMCVFIFIYIFWFVLFCKSLNGHLKTHRNEERYQSRKELRNAKEERKKARQSAAIQALNALRDKQNAMMAFNRGPSTAVGRDILFIYYF